MEINKPAVITFLVFVVTQAVLICLKMFGAVDWSWLFIFAPLWIPYFAILLCGIILTIYIVIFNHKGRKY